jgi:protoheme IX farnesyltransferase
MIKEYYKLAKPGIIYGNVFTTVAAFLFASGPHYKNFNVLLFFATILGIALVIGSACVFNNYIDRDIDRKMKRTSTRALVTGSISVRNALVYGTVLGVVGFVLLFLYVNVLTAGIALFGFFSYVVLYGAAKRKSEWGALIGTLPGAVPIVVGYTAVMNQLDLTALILFLVLVFWQMPHFYAIAIYRLDEYKHAGIPVYPAKRGVRTTKMHILLFIIAYVLVASSLGTSGVATYFYSGSVLLFGFVWLLQSLRGFRLKTGQTNEKWAKKLFFLSLIVLVSFSVTIAIVPALLPV